ncbi:MAG: Lrp/AsnC family transcriptional regulator [Candidatus Puniceispirillales bacterium]|jgi:DNA-binding Lrp family transcriptional regulator|nr:Lrp/AsnC family transcriptional regulator [Pseudomonadota bacterium]|tara:strand:- start:224 stop:709 length:486 start_codon:yes stop_codon:yes gene_type:complete
MKTQKKKLDNIDLLILNELQVNGKISNVELANLVNISPPSCLRRVKVLEDAQYIKGYNADINAELVGFKVTVFAYVGLESQAENDLQIFENYISVFPEVRECHMLIGEVDFLLKIVAKDWDDFQQFLTGKLTQAPKVSNVKTSLNIRSNKRLPGVPLDVTI